MEFEYECGNFKSSSGKAVFFLRVINIADVIKKSVHQLNASGLLVKKSNVPDNVLWILLSGDKGGKSTKLLLQFLNCKWLYHIKSTFFKWTDKLFWFSSYRICCLMNDIILCHWCTWCWQIFCKFFNDLAPLFQCARRGRRTTNLRLSYF